MGFTVEQECPQCGGPIELDETDRLLRCPFCSVENFLFASSYLRFVLPHKTSGKEIIHMPYLRFKGNVYFCQGLNIGYRFVDITHTGLPLKGIPSSLGLRPQAMKMKFVTPATQGSFLKFTLKAADLVAKAAKLTSGASSGTISHRAFIGETLCLIYLPLFVQGNRIFDAVLNKPIAAVPGGRDLFGSEIIDRPKWKLAFLPTICPQCGWNLEGEKDSVVLTCGNCRSAWEASEGKFRKIDVWAVPGKNGGTTYLPFWKVSATSSGVEINSFADFIRVTNQPVVVKKEWENQAMSFWNPAFKIRPRVFLRLSRQVTVSQLRLRPETGIPKKGLYPVTMPCDEAIQAMKLTLAGSAVSKKNILPLLSGIKFTAKGSTLVYLPFSDSGHEMILQDARISINKQTLAFGRRL